MVTLQSIWESTCLVILLDQNIENERSISMSLILIFLVMIYEQWGDTIRKHKLINEAILETQTN